MGNQTGLNCPKCKGYLNNIRNSYRRINGYVYCENCDEVYKAMIDLSKLKRIDEAFEDAKDGN